MKVEKVLANTTAPTVVWIAGSACTGCTMSLLNSVFYTTVDDLLLNRINLTYLDTAMATAGAYVDGTQYPGANALQAAHDVYNAGGFVLVVEGAMPTGTPTGGAAGDYCRIGQLVPGSTADTMLRSYHCICPEGDCHSLSRHMLIFWRYPRSTGKCDRRKGCLLLRHHTGRRNRNHRLTMLKTEPQEVLPQKPSTSRAARLIRTG